MPINIRPAVRQDFPALIGLFREFAEFQKTPEKLHITLEELTRDEEYFRCLIAEKDGVIVGFATFFFAFYSWSGKGIYLDDLYVTGSFRQHGIGRQLLDAVISFAKDSQCRSVRWLVSRWNDNAIRFYESIGTEIDDTEMTCVLPLI